MYGRREPRIQKEKVYRFPQDKVIPDGPSDSVSCMQFAPTISPVSGGLEVLACGSWDSQVCRSLMIRVLHVLVAGMIYQSTVHNTGPDVCMTDKSIF